MHFPEVPCVGHLPGAVPGAGGVHARPFTGGRYRLALAIYRGEVPAGAGHLPEVGTPRGGVHASATFTGPEGFPDRRVHTSAIYRKVYPCRRVPATAIYRKVDPDRRVHALAIYREPMTGAGHLPEAGTRRGRYPARALPG